jgi:hypothetical protein
MKYIIIGMHSSGKQEVIDILKANDIRCGRLFTNVDISSTPNIYNAQNYEQYSTKDINDIFENNAYVFMQEFPFCDNMILHDGTFYEGLSLYEFENNDVFVMSPDQLFTISPTSIKDDITFIWMDNAKKERLNRYHSERRNYNFYDRENIELKDSSSFVKFLYGFDNSNVIYFTSEEPNRVAAIIYSAIKHPDLLPIYTEAFN